MPNIHIFLPEKLNKAIEKEAKAKRRNKADLIYLALVRAYLGEEEFKKEIGEAATED